VTHPTLGLPPRDLASGFTDAAARLRQARTRLATRAVEVAADADPTLLERHDEIGIRSLLRDAEVFIDRLALSVAGDDPFYLASFCEHTTIIYRRNRVRMDDAIQILEGIRAASRGVLAGDEVASAGRAIDAGIHAFREHRKLAGDPRPRNRILWAIYKGG
jgi:hypothetical protein